MFLNTVNEQCVRLLLEPKEKTLYAMVAQDKDATRLLSQAQLVSHFRALFPCLEKEFPLSRANQQLSHIAQMSSDLENECIICMEESSVSNPRMCLPCENQAEKMMRHCSLCKNCMRNWIEQSKSKSNMVTTCPICRTQFDANELEKAFNEGYLDYPIDTGASTLRGWYASEDKNEMKKKGLGDLRVVPASQEWPIPPPVPLAVEDLPTPQVFRVNTGPRMRRERRARRGIQLAGQVS